MSEYQHFEFLALDRSLSVDEIGALRRYSTRASITPGRFFNTYEWGNFKGDIDLWMERYFDVFAYFANWGTRTLKFKVPAALLPESVASPWNAAAPGLVQWRGNAAIVTLETVDEEAGFYLDESEQSPASDAASARNTLLAGDATLLYFGWLCAVMSDEAEDGALEPPVPAGLGDLSPPLAAVAEFLGIGEDLLEEASASSPQPREPADERLAAAEFVAAMAEAERRALLECIVLGDQQAALALRNQFRSAQARAATPKSAAPLRTAAELWEGAERRRLERALRKARAAELAEERRRRDEASRREARLHSLAGREDELWDRIESLLAVPGKRPYPEAVAILSDLRDLHAKWPNAAFPPRLGILKETYRTRKKLLQLIAEAGM